jgi:hypothetical protein
VCEITTHSPSPSMSGQSESSTPTPTPTPAEERPEWESELVDFGHELKSAVDSMLQAYPKYIGFIV